MKNVKYKDLSKLLQETGWVRVRTKGSHEVWRQRATNKTITVPHHDEISKGVLRNLKKSIGKDFPSKWE